MGGHRARNRHEAMAAKKVVAEGLLARAWNPRSQPIGVWHGVGFDDMNLRNIGNPRRRDHVRYGVEGLETLVDGDL